MLNDTVVSWLCVCVSMRARVCVCVSMRARVCVCVCVCVCRLSETCLDNMGAAAVSLNKMDVAVMYQPSYRLWHRRRTARPVSCHNPVCLARYLRLVWHMTH